MSRLEYIFDGRAGRFYECIVGGVMSDPDLVTTPNCAYVACSYSDGEAFAENSFAFEYQIGPIGPVELKALADFMHAWHTTQVMPLLSIDVQSLDSIAIDVTTYPNSVASSFPSVQVSGTGDEAIPMVCAMRLDFLTGSTGVWFRGRNYIAALPRSVVVRQHIDVTFANAVKTAYETLPTDIAPTHWTWGVISNRFGGTLRASGLFTPITAVYVPDLRIRTWRQRIARFGT